jgi:lipopolysaccharide export system protein LptC
MTARWRARVLLLVLIALAAWAAWRPRRSRSLAVADDDTDIALYRAIVNRMIDGAGYYRAVGAEQVDRGYPVSPAPAVCEPTLAWFV